MAKPHTPTGKDNKIADKPKGEKPGLASRKTAADILGNVIYKRRPLDSELEPISGHAGFRALPDNDRSLVRAILGKCLRHRGELNAILDRLLDKRIPEKTGRVVDILHVAMAQMLYLDIPDRAAVSLAVEHAGFDRRARPYKGLVNGILRRLGRERESVTSDLDAERLNTQDWMFENWCAAYGEDNARAISRAHMDGASLDLTIKSGDSSLWAEKLGGVEVGAGSIRLQHKGTITQLDGFKEGEWWVQDAAAALPARLLGNINGLEVADLCAAPGGKTAQLAAAGAQVTAVDISKSRLKRVTENMQRLHLKANIVATDLREWVPDRLFDAILLDAPCSATGTIRKSPDVAWLKQAYDVGVLSGIQAELLRRATSWLKPGGHLVYCTCSLEKAEGEELIAGFLSEMSSAFALVPVQAGEIGNLDHCISKEGFLRTLPCHTATHDTAISGMDGFFAARLKKL